MYRIEDQGLTLRLFNTAETAQSAFQPDSRQSRPRPTGLDYVQQYGPGWLVRHMDGSWHDAHGPLPSEWAPSPLLTGSIRGR